MLLNSLANVVKVGAIWATDAVNAIYDPFRNFDRPEEPKYFEHLKEKAVKFETDLQDFWWPTHNVFLYTLPGNSGDQALWHGVYTAMLASKYSVTGALVDITVLEEAVKGLLSHQQPLGEPLPRLIRGWREDGTYEDEVSNDQASGHLLGIYFAWKYGNVACRVAAKTLITGLADELAINSNNLINADGSPTKHGKLENGLYTDPLNLTLLLAIYKLAYEIVGENLYKIRYDDLCEKYRILIPYAKVKLLWLDEQQAGHRAAIHYTILCDLEKDHDLNRKYLRGLLRVWRISRKGANPWIYFLVRRICLVDPAHENLVRKHLKEFTLEDKQHNAERINSTGVETFKWGGHLRCRQPLPRWRVGSQDFFWQRHLYSADDWIGNGTGNLRHNGGDFLAAYWGLRSLRIIGSGE